MPDISEKKIRKVVKGPVKVRSKSEFEKVANNFFDGDFKEIKKSLFQDVLIPAVKKIIDDLVTNSIHLALYGNAAPQKKSGNTTVVHYDNSYNVHRKISSSPVKKFEYRDILLNSRSDAEAVRNEMDETLEKYGRVTVADYYDICGYIAGYGEDKYGWTDLRGMRIVASRDGWYVELPPAEMLK